MLLYVFQVKLRQKELVTYFSRKQNLLITGMKYMIGLLKACLSYHCMGQCQQVRAYNVISNLIHVNVNCKGCYKQYPNQISILTGKNGIHQPICYNTVVLFCWFFHGVHKLIKLEPSLYLHRSLLLKFISTGNGFTWHQSLQLRKGILCNWKFRCLIQASHFILYGKDIANRFLVMRVDL